MQVTVQLDEFGNATMGLSSAVEERLRVVLDLSRHFSDDALVQLHLRAPVTVVRRLTMQVCHRYPALPPYRSP